MENLESNYIQCLDLTTESLARLESNDPSLRGVKVKSESWIEGAGIAFAQTKFLTKLEVSITLKSDIRWCAEFCAGIARNDTIEELILEFEDGGGGNEVDVFRLLAPFFRNNPNLHSIEIIKDFRSPLPNLLTSISASVLADDMSVKLKKFAIAGNRYESYEEVVALIESLGSKENLLDLAVQGIDLDESRCTALANLIQKPSSKIHTLGLLNSNVSPDGMAILCNAMTKNINLHSLDLSGTSTSISCCLSLSLVLSYTVSSLKWLRLAESNIGDVGVSFLGDALAVNNKLQFIDLYGNRSITLKGWQAFSNCLRNPQSALKELGLDYCGIDDKSASTVATALAANNSVKKLDISSNRIRPAGAVNFYRIVLEGSVLEELFLDDIEISDISEEECRGLSLALCDKTTILSTFNSNHTFHTCEYVFNSWNAHHSPIVVGEICTLLDLNKITDKVEVARRKILGQHFYGATTGIHTLACLHESVLPYAFEWMGRDRHGYSAMFKFVQSSPTLFDVSREQVIGRKKRKI